jgi:hypothetical protein
MKTYGVIAPPFLTSALNGGERSAIHPGRFINGERASVSIGEGAVQKLFLLKTTAK